MQQIIIKWVLAHSLWFFTPEQITGWVPLLTDAVGSGRKCTDPTTSAGNSVLTGHLIAVLFFLFFYARATLAALQSQTAAHLTEPVSSLF